MAEQVADFPKKLQFLFESHRYKIAYGGRGSAKSWSFARALLILGANQTLRILCAREVQKSIRDSVHRLLGDQIEALGLGAFYEILETEIRGRNGTLFAFVGLSNVTADSIKSYEGVDIVWVEEAQAVSDRSWSILTPTIRKADSEIWVSFNPELDTDPTYKRFVVNPPAEAAVAEVNWHDNQWFPDVLEKERLHCLATDPDGYPTIWEGKCRSAVVGAIYAKEVDAAIRGGRVTSVPYDPRIKVHVVYDLGWNDSMVLVMVQRVRSELRVIDYIEDSHKTLDWYMAELIERRYNWGFDFIPHDGKAKDFKTGKSTEEILKAFGRRVKVVPNIGLREGIRAARLTFAQTVFEKTKAARLIECLKRYRRKVNVAGEDGEPVHDEWSHGADAYRYVAVAADQMDNDERPVPAVTPYQPAVRGVM